MSDVGVVLVYRKTIDKASLFFTSVFLDRMRQNTMAADVWFSHSTTTLKNQTLLYHIVHDVLRRYFRICLKTRIYPQPRRNLLRTTHCGSSISLPVTCAACIWHMVQVRRRNVRMKNKKRVNLVSLKTQPSS